MGVDSLGWVPGSTEPDDLAPDLVLREGLVREHPSCKQLLTWAGFSGKLLTFGIEGTGSYGATPTAFLRRHGYKILEAGRADRRRRRMNGEFDTLATENAARSVIAGFATAVPKAADSGVEMIRQFKIAYDSAVTDRSAAMISMKGMLFPPTTRGARRPTG